MEHGADEAASLELENFLPYRLNRLAEAVSRDFQTIYRTRYGLTRPEWRLLASLGQNGTMTATEVGRDSAMHKTKVSRAVAHLERQGLLARHPSETDGRAEILSLTDTGLAAFADLGQRAFDYDKALRKVLGAKAAKDLNRILLAIIAMRADAATESDD